MQRLTMNDYCTCGDLTPNVIVGGAVVDKMKCKIVTKFSTLRYMATARNGQGKYIGATCRHCLPKRHIAHSHTYGTKANHVGLDTFPKYAKS
mmetsp:Transcript_64921/g.127668  ORF Transcript_64921/g.127668 Transcript_64921/m.127668 type:complete len:92 (+) Transcript_64921:115-390(+)